jgi:hypothetical protein
MSERVKEVVADEVQRVKALSQDAARSGAYLYPLKVSQDKPEEFARGEETSLPLLPSLSLSLTHTVLFLQFINTLSALTKRLYADILFVRQIICRPGGWRGKK